MIVVPVQIIMWADMESFAVGVMVMPVDDDGEEYAPLFLLTDTSDAPHRPHMLPCQLCNIREFHVHPAMDHFAYVGDGRWVSDPPATGGFKQNSHGWMTRMRN